VTTPAVLPHVDAVTSALTAASMTVYFGGAPPDVAPTAAEPYIVLYPTPGRAVPASLVDDLVDFAGEVQLTCVGLTAEQAASVSDRAMAALAVRLTVTGRVSWKPEFLDGQPVQRDDDVTPPNFYAVARYRLRSIPQ
jgi:hypothetical protein